jgi:hypothetical protein
LKAAVFRNGIPTFRCNRAPRTLVGPAWICRKKRSSGQQRRDEREFSHGPPHAVSVRQPLKPGLLWTMMFTVPKSCQEPFARTDRD